MERRASIVQTRFRLRKKLLSQLAREAKRNDRSLNDEVERRLEQSLWRPAEPLALPQQYPPHPIEWFHVKP